MIYRVFKIFTKKIKKALRIINNHKIDIAILMVIIGQWIFSAQTLAYSLPKEEFIPKIKNAVGMQTDIFEVAYTKKTTITAYSSTPDQTDSTPCITANGFNLCKHGQENIIAANFLPFGAKVRIPDHFGDKIFIVQDRMNSRYKNRVDIWMKNRSSAKQWGIKYAQVEILK